MPAAPAQWRSGLLSWTKIVNSKTAPEIKTNGKMLPL
jgi:hypothetical protein